MVELLGDMPDINLIGAVATNGTIDRYSSSAEIIPVFLLAWFVGSCFIGLYPVDQTKPFLAAVWRRITDAVGQLQYTISSGPL